MSMIRLSRLLSVCAGTLMLSACLLTPGKFDSTLDIRTDRSFTFTYKGEIIATDPSSAMNGLSDDKKGATEDAPADAKESAYMRPVALQQDGGEKDAAPSFGDKKKDQTAKMQAIATALIKEKGFRSVVYKGDNRFDIDYAISSKLDHTFIWPFNSDAQAVLPFVAIELRGDDRVRVKAPGYANSSKESSGMGGNGIGNDAAKALDGRFTLTTDGEFVSHNQEEGPTKVANGKQLFWKVDPLTTEAPTAVIRLSGK